jgi:hypothetical protein
LPGTGHWQMRGVPEQTLAEVNTSTLQVKEFYLTELNFTELTEHFNAHASSPVLATTAPRDAVDVGPATTGRRPP